METTRFPLFDPWLFMIDIWIEEVSTRDPTIHYSKNKQHLEYCLHDSVDPVTHDSACGQNAAVQQQINLAPQQAKLLPQLKTITDKHVLNPYTFLIATSKLHLAKLKKHGLSLDRLLDGDALFFYQMLLSFHLDKESEKEENKTNRRNKPFYSEVKPNSHEMALHTNQVINQESEMHQHANEMNDWDSELIR
eukprot:jgi/Psemu1/23119/gm1.23119_g